MANLFKRLFDGDPQSPDQPIATTKEGDRLMEASDRTVHWKRWGPYLSDRQWGTVREDYSADGNAWEYLPFDQARSRAYRWGEDGILGICDNHQRLCFALTLWNGEDPFLKERLFGLTSNQGNHGEDVKEYYYYLDSTPTHSYMKGLYKYPQAAFPYEQLLEENQKRDRLQSEYELIDTGIFEGDRYYDVFVEYAKAAKEDILVKITVHNRGAESKLLHVLPTLWFRNTWTWHLDAGKPSLQANASVGDAAVVGVDCATLGKRWLYCAPQASGTGAPELLFTDNETNNQRIFGTENLTPYVKDGINNYLVHGDKNAINPAKVGTKAAAHYVLQVEPGESKTIYLRLSDTELPQPFGQEFERVFRDRIQEADEFYQKLANPVLTEDMRNVQRQAFAGMLWSKQFFYYVIDEWLKGDLTQPPPPPERLSGRNASWIHLFNDDIISMPDKWEYPWYAAWDLAFHCIPLAMVDPDFAKKQLDLMTREWYMHPNGQLPAYEWNFSDVNPPVHAWATWEVYKLEEKMTGKGDRVFLERVFQKLMLNFTWWVNRKDKDGTNIFEGGFLGLDNIGVFDRSAPLPTGGHIEQADGTSWMGMYCLNMLTIALELAKENPVYEDMATKFFEHFIYIADAMNHIGSLKLPNRKELREDGTQLWDNEDGFFYDVLKLPGNEEAGTETHQMRLKVRSMVGLIPLLAVTILEPEQLQQFPGFKKRLEWFINNREELKRNVACMETTGIGARRMLALCYASYDRMVEGDKLRRILVKMLDETEFLSDFGIRALSRYHKDNPYVFSTNGHEYRVDYDPAESSTPLFGGNSNWRGPVWMPVNYAIVAALRKFHMYLGDTYKVECPTGSGNWMTLGQVAEEISLRLARIFLKDAAGHRPVFRSRSRSVRDDQLQDESHNKFQTDPHWQDWILFYEYFHGDLGSGVGASHQTGWTGLIAELLQHSGQYIRERTEG